MCPLSVTSASTAHEVADPARCQDDASRYDASRMPRLTFGIALDFGSKLRPLQAQLERQSALLEVAEAAGCEMVAAGESVSAGGFHLPNALLVLAALAQRT